MFLPMGARMSVQSISDACFEREVHQAALPVLVDFGTTWCAPCKHLEPTLEDLAQELEGVVKIVKVDMDDNPVMAWRIGVRGMLMRTSMNALL